MDDYPKFLFAAHPENDPNGKNTVSGPNPQYELREQLHNGRPAWDRVGSIHHSICWTPFDNNAEYGFWAVANLWTLDSDGQATGIVFEVPEVLSRDGPTELGPTATNSKMPPMGWWCRGRPWDGSHTSGGRQMFLSVNEAVYTPAASASASLPA